MHNQPGGLYFSQQIIERMNERQQYIAEIIALMARTLDIPIKSEGEYISEYPTSAGRIFIKSIATEKTKGRLLKSRYYEASQYIFTAMEKNTDAVFVEGKEVLRHYREDHNDI